MKINSLCVSIVALAAGQVCSAADITGAVTVSGTPPAALPITPLKEDVTCGKNYTDMPMTKFYVVGPNKELADVVVVLTKGVTSKSSGASAKPVVLDQKGCLYVPQILAIQIGQKLQIKNSDPMPVAMHNVRTVPAAAGNTVFNKSQMAGGADLEITIPAAENFLKFQCDVHPWMFAWVTVVDHPYFAVTDKDGKYKISNVPPGKYTITALHRKAAPTGMDKEIEVKDAEAKQDFTLEAK